MSPEQFSAIMACFDEIREMLESITKAASKPKKAPKERKAGETALTGTVQSVGAVNDWGYRKIRFEDDDRDFSTGKGDEGLVKTLKTAQESGGIVAITFDTVNKDKGGKTYTNRYIKTVEVTEGSSPKPAANDDDSDCPF